MIDNEGTYFKLKDHCFIVDDYFYSKLDKSVLPKIKCVRYTGKWGFVPIINKFSQKDKLIIHGLFNPRLLFYLYFRRDKINKCVWSIWGGDVYFYKHRQNNIKHDFVEYLRKTIIPQIPVVVSLIRGDYEIVKKVYGSNAKYIYSFYPNPVDFNLIKNLTPQNREDGIKIILVGNSGDPANNHQEVFEFLDRFKDKDIKIICPLSYGNAAYIKKIVFLGNKMFGLKFEPLTEFISPYEYVKVLSSVDVAIMNHERQQGLGNTIALLALGKKVFIRSDTSPFEFFAYRGIKIFDTLKIKDLSFNQIFELDKNIAEKNRLKVLDVFSEKEACENWQKVFDEITLA